MRARSYLVALVVMIGCDSPAPPASSSPAITGGVVATGDPAVVALVVPVMACGGAPEVYCTGTIVGPRTVVTAAHCLDYAPPGVLQIHIGGDATDAASGRRVEVVAELAHPAATMTTHDIAVLELAEAVSETPIALHAGTLDSSLVGSQVRIIGFGIDDDGMVGRKREGTATIASIGDDTFALTPAPSNTCVGDSGGPVLLQVGATEVLIGVTSFGDPGCTQSATNTRVDVNRDDFLADTIASINGAAAPGARSPLSSGMTLCEATCASAADCPAGTACVDGTCGLGGRVPGRFVGTCQVNDDCKSGVCAPLGAASCECYEPCDDCDGGCSAGTDGPRGSSWFPLLLGLLFVICRRNRPAVCE